jgi:uncharacterized membrane protein YqaE (UPF0057 family)
MKKSTLFLFLSAVFLSGIFLSSCSSERNVVIEKRHYGKGYYVHTSGERTPASAAVVNSKSPAAENAVKNPSKDATNSALTNNPDVQIQSAIPSSENNIQTKNTTATSAKKSLSVKHRSAFVQKVTEKINAVENKNHLSISLKPKSSPESGGGNDIDPIILVILAILISPLAVFLKERATNRFWIDLICWALGIAGFAIIFYSSFLVLFAVVFALLIVLDVI